MLYTAAVVFLKFFRIYTYDFILPFCFNFVPKRIAQNIPKVKIIIILRNPIDRAWSHYWHEVKKGREQLKYEDAIKYEKERITKDFNAFCTKSYIKRGIYVSQIQNYLQYFSENQMFFLIFEEFVQNTMLEIKRLYRFLGVDEYFNVNKIAKAQAGRSEGGRILAVATLPCPATTNCTCSVTNFVTVAPHGGTTQETVYCIPVANVPNSGAPVTTASVGWFILGSWTVTNTGMAVSANWGTGF